MSANNRRLKLGSKARYQRPIATDILPFEVPPSFSNSGLFFFLTKLDLKTPLSSGVRTVRWCASDDRYDDIISILFRIKTKSSDTFHTFTETVDGKVNHIREWEIETQWSIPFNFRISHKETEPRQLSVIHPQNQVFVADFYNCHSSEILYHCAKSNFSIRHPSSIAKTVRFKDRLFLDNQGSSEDTIEEYGKKYEGSGSFFVYEKYSNIFKFYENHAYLNAEKKFKKTCKIGYFKLF